MAPSLFNSITTPTVKSPHIFEFEVLLGAAPVNLLASSFKPKVNTEVVGELCIKVEDFHFPEKQGPI